MPVLPEPAEWDFDKLGHRGKKFPTQELTSKAGYLVIEIDGTMDARLRQRVSDFVYHVLEGSGSFDIDDVTYPCGVGDLVVVPAGSVATYRGTMRMLLVSAPPWSPDQEDVLS